MHTFLASYPNGKKEVIKSRLLDFGTPATDTSVARTVALPAAIAAKMILNGKINIKGVYRPVLSEIYNPVLDELEKIGIKMIENYNLPESEMINYLSCNKQLKIIILCGKLTRLQEFLDRLITNKNLL